MRGHGLEEAQALRPFGRRRRQRVDRGVGVGRVVVEEDEAPHPGPAGHLRRVVDGAVAELRLAGLFLVGELGVVDQEVGAAQRSTTAGETSPSRPGPNAEAWSGT